MFQAEIIHGLKKKRDGITTISETCFFIVHLTTNLCSFECHTICPGSFHLGFHVEGDY